jgi:hypothetical protein
MIVSGSSIPVKTHVVSPSVSSRLQASSVANIDDAGAERSGSAVSLLARQLSAAAGRAQSRHAVLDPQALAQKAEQILRELSNDTSQADLPAVSPYRGMPRDQLALIIYDEGNEFSANERNAALQEASDQERLWRQGASQRAFAEFRACGKMTGFFKEALAHLRALPAIEQAQYPGDYAADLQRRIELSADSRTLLEEAGVSTPRSLIEKSLPTPGFVQPERNDKAEAAASVLPITDLSDSAVDSLDDRGRQLMVSRLFGGVEPPVIEGKLGMSLANSGYSDRNFLTHQDRELLSDVYRYAVDNDIDMIHIDVLAREIGNYRRHDNGRIMGSANGGSYTSEGWQVTVSFIDRDAAIASRLLSGAAINSTRFDQDFLRYILNPGFGAIGNSGNFPLIEHLVNYFSAEAGSVSPPGDQFSRYVEGETGKYYVRHVSTTIRRPVRNTIEDEAPHPAAANRTLGRVLEDNGSVAPRSLIEMLKQNGSLDVARKVSANEGSDRQDSVWDPVQLKT